MHGRFQNMFDIIFLCPYLALSLHTDKSCIYINERPCTIYHKCRRHANRPFRAAGYGNTQRYSRFLLQQLAHVRRRSHCLPHTANSRRGRNDNRRGSLFHTPRFRRRERGRRSKAFAHGARNGKEDCTRSHSEYRHVPSFDSKDVRGGIRGEHNKRRFGRRRRQRYVQHGSRLGSALYTNAHRRNDKRHARRRTSYVAFATMRGIHVGRYGLSYRTPQPSGQPGGKGRNNRPGIRFRKIHGAKL